MELNIKETALKTERMAAKNAADLTAEKLAEAEEKVKSELKVFRMESEQQLDLIRKQHQGERPFQGSVCSIVHT